jgi:hypothetical protein
MVERQRRQPAAGLADLRKAAELALLRDQQGVLGMAQFQLGLAYRDLERGREAVAAFEAHLASTRQAEGAPGEAQALERLGSLFSGEIRREWAHGLAVHFFQRALAVHRTRGDRVGQAWVLSRIGDVRVRQQRCKDAFRTYWRDSRSPAGLPTKRISSG